MKPDEYRVFTNKEEELKFEENRYNEIASKSKERYSGLEATQVDLRMSKMVEYVLKHEQPSLNIGPGFGQLEKVLPPERLKIALDITENFLKGLNDIPNVIKVKGQAENMPFPSDSIPTVTTQSSFQVFVDQEAFLRELARVLKPNGFFAITIEYHWNYPRKPQKFYAHETDKLKTFIESLGLKVDEIKYLNDKGEWCQTLEEGFSLWIIGSKPL